MPDIFTRADAREDEPIEAVRKTVTIHHNGRIRIFDLEFDFIGDDLVDVHVIGA